MIQKAPDVAFMVHMNYTTGVRDYQHQKGFFWGGRRENNFCAQKQVGLRTSKPI